MHSSRRVRTFGTRTFGLNLSYSCDPFIGHAMNSSGDCEGAIKYLKSAVQMLRKLKLVGQEKEKLATALYNLGLAYEIYPDNQKALQVPKPRNCSSFKTDVYKHAYLLVFK